MIDILLVWGIIIASLLYVAWKKAYMSQILIITNFIIFIYYIILQQTDIVRAYDMVHGLTFVPARLGNIGYSHTLITSMFMHSNGFHILGNCLFLYLLGMPLEERIGTKRWAILYFSTGIIATFSFYLFNIDSIGHLLGASGAIFGIAGSLLVLYPNDKVLLPIPLFFIMLFRRVKVWIAVGLLFVIETVLVIIAVQDGVAHIAHVGGLIGGIFLAPLIFERTRTESEKDIDLSGLKEIATTEKELAILEKIENEEVEDVRKVWVDEFFKVATCPYCSRPLEKVSGKIKCECGKEFKVLK